MICVHCGIGLTLQSGNSGLYQHANNLGRCQGGPDGTVPYGHMGHPEMPCPSGTVNDCLGSREENCNHLAVPA